ncbi:chromosome segregation protein SMC [Natroniella sulfidigena]|uniref:chromosome segregation protein SMC n=1 Tax=Natroniella sulfidigena TaxID=723921 RepID=UPI00200AF0D6|nr:chromosome segregation protein SMC [Natroniella sulfidigena]MCK8816565.1 chromosome segregation protein SMC [Natroniella sulfidigena]
MFLKRIELKGFKSFADKVKIDFEPAITGIIGPNGSGKSNISDAVRWVLGEQSAKTLRGSKMEDIIFAGSKQRRALGMAQVSLILDNSQGELPIDYNQVTISRRVTRSGESDYLINNNICRLKDIQELLLDTGIGKDSYSIIGQGKVDQILSERSVDRRELFEEAAGISKHKQRKKEANKKLESTEQKLNRVRDIIEEIKRQLEPLEEEATKAKEYKSYQEELKELEVNLLLNQYVQLEDKFDQQVATKQRLSYQLTEAKAGVNEFDLKIDSCQTKQKELVAAIDQQKDDIFNTKRKLERLESKLELLSERKKNLREQKGKLKKEITELKDKTDLMKEEINEKKRGKDDLAEQLEQKLSLLAQKEDEVAQIKKRLTETLGAKREIEDNKLAQANQITDYKHQIENLTKEIERYQHESRNLIKAKEDLEEKFTEIKEQKEVKLKQLEKIEAELLKLQDDYQQQESNQEELKQELNALQKEYQQLKEELNNKESRLNVLEGMQDNYQGYYRGVKNLLNHIKQSGDLKGVCGVVAELIEVPQEYETAIEVALGSKLQNVIVEDDQVGKRAINYLKDNQAGRATMLPLNLVAPRSLRKSEEEGLEIEGAIGVAKDLINYQARYRPVIENILGRVIVAQNIDQAVEISKATNKRVKVVTLAGDVVNPGGAMTGGSYAQDNNLLGRSREIEQLRIEVKKLSKKRTTLEEQGLAKKEELATNQQQMEKIKERLHQLEIQQTTCKKDKQQLGRELARIQKEIEFKVDKIEQLEQQVIAVETTKKEAVSNLKQLTTTEDDLESTTEQLDSEISSNKEKEELLTEQITDLKVELASVKEGKKNLEAELIKLEQELKQAQQQLKQKEEQIVRLDNKQIQLKDTAQNLASEQQELNSKLGDLEERLFSLRQEEKEAKEKIIQFQQQSKEVRERYQKLQQEYNEIEVELAQLEVKLTNVETKLTDEYQLDIDLVVEERTAIEDFSEVKAKIKKLKQAMKRLEPVNLGAIKEYKNLNQRFSFLKEQSNDLTEAKRSLQKVIAEINEKMTEKFATAFKEIKSEFEGIFTDLFGGGQAQLTLEDEDDLLKTGVEINAQPPGKKLQKLSLMSGGEKALTATALVFALLKVNPSPFYVLDELDAPLDDANVERFANYLDKLSSQTQFVVITHRKGTMKVANSLYGVTMEESGVSKLVSLQLDQLAAF